MEDLREQITQLADLIDEFGLDEAKLEGDGWYVELSKYSRRGVPAAAPTMADLAATSDRPPRRPAKREPPREAPQGIPVTSPMTGIYYASPSPGRPPFVKVGDVVSPGQVVGLIEAMKVFNEITATVGGTVASTPVADGQLVQPGEVLLTIA